MKQGLLRPLPVPGRTWQELSMDFITKLPESNGCTNMMVITDRLGKGARLFDMATITAEDVAKLFMKEIYKVHGLPRAIVSDRGSQFVGQVWTVICRMLRIKSRLSTAYHPETDGATERKNADVEATVRIFTNTYEDVWAEHLWAVEYALNNRENKSTGLTPFYVYHGYHADPFSLAEEPRENARISSANPTIRGEAIASKLREAQEWAAASMAVAQQDQEYYANQRRAPAPIYKVGDQVWFKLTNARRKGHDNKKLDWVNAKYTVTKVVSPHAVRLDIPGRIFPTVHVDKLRLASTDPLPSQVVEEWNPEPIQVEGEDEYDVECIVDEHKTNDQMFYLVKWRGWDTLPQDYTWESLEAMEDTKALDKWEALNDEERSALHVKFRPIPYKAPRGKKQRRIRRGRL